MQGGTQQDLFGLPLLADRLRSLGLRGVRCVETHQNRTVMVSLTGRKVLRVHRGYAYAPDDVLSAIVRFVDPDSRRSVQLSAEKALLAYPVEEFVSVARRTRGGRRPAPRREDLPFLRELKRRHQELNVRHFGGGLAGIAFRISWKMRTRLGELLLDRRTEQPQEISISRRHLLRDGWDEVEGTLLHEMIHQWQAESGHSVDHGKLFRDKAREVGVPARAVRIVGSRQARRPLRRRRV